MKDRNLTQHAQMRKQQRGISDLQIELINYFGDDHYQKGGDTLSFISEKKLTQLRDAIDKLQNVAMVKTPSERVVTTMHMQRKIKRTRYVA